MTDPKPKLSYEYQTPVIAVHVTPTKKEPFQPNPDFRNQSVRQPSEPDRRVIIERLINYIKDL